MKTSAEKRVKVTLRMPVYLDRKLAEIAQRRGISLNELMLERLRAVDARPSQPNL